MTTESEKLLQTNPHVTLNEYVWTHVKEILENYGWLREPVSVLTSITMSPKAEQNLSEARERLQTLMTISDEALQKEYDAVREKRRAILERAESLLVQVAAWPGTEDEQFAQQSVQTELAELIELNKPIDGTLEQYKRGSFRVAIECVDKAEKVYRINRNTVQNINKSLVALRAILGDPPVFAPTAQG